jgi:integrase
LGKIHRTEQVNSNVNPLSRKELTLLLKTFKKHYGKHYALALLLACTGMRIGEALALQWGDMDFNSRYIVVQRSITKKGKIETPKNDKSRRGDMSRQLTAVLLELKH